MVVVMTMVMVTSPTTSSSNPLHDLLLLGRRQAREGCQQPPAHQGAHEQFQHPAPGDSAIG
jgi:hypothetical protein